MLYVVTAVHNRYAITEEFVKRLKAQSFRDFRLVLVDDGCTDGTAEMVKSALPDSVILTGDGNLWWGGAMHMAYKWIMKNAKKDDFVMITNDDTQFEEDYLETAHRLISENKDALITGCGFSINSGCQIDGAVQFNYRNGAVSLKQGTAESNCASTRALVMTYAAMKKTGGFHPILLPHYASDYEYTIRAKRKGHKILAFSEFCYKFDEGTTGNHNPKGASLKQIFSKRSVFNPIYRFAFIFMVTPLKDLPSHIGEQIKRFNKSR